LILLFRLKGLSRWLYPLFTTVLEKYLKAVVLQDCYLLPFIIQAVIATKSGKQFSAKTFIRSDQFVPELIKFLFKVVKLGVITVTFEIESVV